MNRGLSRNGSNLGPSLIYKRVDLILAAEAVESHGIGSQVVGGEEQDVESLGCGLGAARRDGQACEAGEE